MTKIFICKFVNDIRLSYLPRTINLWCIMTIVIFHLSNVW